MRLSIQELYNRVLRIDTIPTVPAIVRPLLEMMAAPVEEVPLRKVEQLVACDASIAAQCLKMANSPLYASHNVTSIASAVSILGLRRVQSILLTCSLNKAVPKDRWVVDPTIFWRHSLGCALVARKLAEVIGYHDLEKAYLAGLLHDLGIIVTSIVYPDGFRHCLKLASEERLPLHICETEELGFTHCESGAILAKEWNLSEEVRDVIYGHHLLDSQRRLSPLISLVHVSDLLCRVRDLGYGYPESLTVDLVAEPSWVFLVNHYPKLEAVDLARFTLDTDEWMLDIQNLVNTVFSRA